MAVSFAICAAVFVLPVADTIADPIADRVAHPVADPTADPVADPIADPVADPIADPITHPVAYPVRNNVPLRLPHAGPGRGVRFYLTLVLLGSSTGSTPACCACMHYRRPSGTLRSPVKMGYD